MHTEGAPAWIWSPLPGRPRWSTAITGVLVFLVVLWRTRRALPAVAAAMAWVCGYEVVYQATGSLLHGWSLGTLALTIAGTGGWLVLAYFLGIRPDWRVLAVFAAVWAVWILAGFESNMPDRMIPGSATTWSWRDELLNVGTKTVLAVAVATSDGRMRQARSTSPAS